MQHIDYYFSLNSPWSYLGSARFRAIARRHECTVNVKPTKFAEVFSKTGGLPLARRSAERRAYRLMELKRWRSFLAVPIVIEPQHFPASETTGTRLVLAAGLAGKDALGLASEIGRSLWEFDQNIAEWAVLEAAAQRTGLDATDLRDACPAEADLDRLWDGNTQDAIACGVFGAPSYVLASGEIFWGQDRLDFLDRALAVR